MVITGERTVPGIWHENYWFRRHEVVYLRLAGLVAGKDVLEAGCGEGYGAHLLAGHAKSLHALDYDECATGHVRAAYPDVPVLRGNLVQLPYADASFDTVVSLQTIEHLWNQEAFIAECLRVLRPGGTIVVSTPNTLTFPPGNIYHPKELAPDELRDLIAPYAPITSYEGLGHGPALAAWEHANGSIIDAQIARPYDEWDASLADQVRAVTVDDFSFSSDDLDESLDLIIVAMKTA
ncbi:MAG: class I SAM-dependent methyltransferase [Actinomycetota bacterium]|nr:class I SAM-dependent methyltransferase [Actinomycetota bacterium]